MHTNSFNMDFLASIDAAGAGPLVEAHALLNAMCAGLLAGLLALLHARGPVDSAADHLS